MWKRIFEFIQKIFQGNQFGISVNKAHVDNATNSTIIVGDNNNVTKGQEIHVEDEKLVITDMK